MELIQNQVYCQPALFVSQIYHDINNLVLDDLLLWQYKDVDQSVSIQVPCQLCLSLLTVSFFMAVYLKMVLISLYSVSHVGE